MGFLKSLFGNRELELEKMRLEEERRRIAAEEENRRAEERRRSQGFNNTIPSASVEWLKAQAIQVFQSRNLNYSEQENQITFKGTLKNDLQAYSLGLSFMRNGILIGAVPQHSAIPTDRFSDMAELINRINCNLTEASFAIRNDAHCYFVCSTFLLNNGESTTVDDIYNSVIAVVDALEGYGNAIVKTIKGIGSPASNEARATELYFL